MEANARVKEIILQSIKTTPDCFEHAKITEVYTNAVDIELPTVYGTFTIGIYCYYEDPQGDIKHPKAGLIDFDYDEGYFEFSDDDFSLEEREKIQKILDNYDFEEGIFLPTPLEIVSPNEIHKEDKTMDRKFYKAAAIQITDDGKNTGTSVFVPEFNSLKDAERFAREHLLSDLSIIKIREYEASKTNVIAFDMPQDTGKQVFRDVSGIKARVIDEFKKAHEKYDDWEDTMSYMIDCIKFSSSSSHGFEADFDYLYNAIDLLTDEEVNEILSFDGSDEYMKCENGSLVPVNEREME